MRAVPEERSQRPRGSEATIVAPATPPGPGSVSILRLPGPDAFSISSRLTGFPPGAHPARTLSRCPVRNAAGEEIDTGLVVHFPAPNNFTGEDVAEIHMHGNPLIVAEAAESACALGARAAEPGEFSRRAFENGKMDLTQAEGLCDLILARTAASARAALRQLKGGIQDAVTPLRERLLSLLVLLEATIDFSDEEDIAPLSMLQVKERVSELRSDLSRYIASYAPELRCTRSMSRSTTIDSRISSVHFRRRTSPNTLMSSKSCLAKAAMPKSISKRRAGLRAPRRRYRAAMC